jgi:acyl carrier protein
VKPIRETVLAVVLEVAQQAHPERSSVEPAHRLAADLGFVSLDLAQVAAELEAQLGFDPFTKTSASGVATVGDLIALYERARS